MSAALDPAIVELRSRAKANELTYSLVMDCLRSYKSPRAKLTKLLKSGALIRVKKGLYVFGSPFVKGQVCKELLANLIYGPSYVSLEWAMSYYGMIPERVEEITSVTVKRAKEFDTPIGRFSYFHTNPKRYPIGYILAEQVPYQNFYIATKEKALCDLLTIRRGKVASVKEMLEILLEDFRIDEEDLPELKRDEIQQIYEAMPHSAIEYLLKALEKLSYA